MMKIYSRSLSCMGVAAVLLMAPVQAWPLKAWGDDSKVIDLGEMSVHGEIRRPAITWIDSQKPVKDVLSKIVQNEFERFEAQLLESALAESKK